MDGHQLNGIIRQQPLPADQRRKINHCTALAYTFHAFERTLSYQWHPCISRVVVTLFFNGFKSSGLATWHGMTRHLLGAKTSPEPLLTYCHLNHYLDQCWFTVNWTRKKKYRKIWIKLRTFSASGTHFKISVNWQPSCSRLHIVPNGHDAITTSLSRQNDVVTSFRHNNDAAICVICLLGRMKNILLQVGYTRHIQCISFRNKINTSWMATNFDLAHDPEWRRILIEHIICSC